MTKTFTKKCVQGSEVEIYKALNQLAEKYNHTFSILVLPVYLSYDTKNDTLTLPFYEGVTYNNQWSESDGGSQLSIGLVDKVLKVIEDLSTIDTSFILSDPKLKGIPNFVFNHLRARQYYGPIAEELLARGIISKGLLLAIVESLDYRQDSALIISNGDFYPRNFIKQKNGRLVLIDWEAWGANTSPFYIIDHPENVAATFYVHMWGNALWQEKYLSQLRSKFKFHEESLKKGIVLKALALANFWLDDEDKELTKNQVKIIERVLL